MRFALIIFLLLFVSENVFADVSMGNVILKGKGIQNNVSLFRDLKLRVERITGLSTDAHVVFRFFNTTTDFVKAVRVKWWIASVYVKGDGVYLQPISVLRKKHMLKRAFVHEYIHFLLDRCGYKLPVWVSEALAVHYENEIFGKKHFKNFYTEKVIKSTLIDIDDRMKYLDVYAVLGDYGTFILDANSLSELKGKDCKWFEVKLKEFLSLFPK